MLRGIDHEALAMQQYTHKNGHTGLYACGTWLTWYPFFATLPTVLFTASQVKTLMLFVGDEMSILSMKCNSTRWLPDSSLLLRTRKTPCANPYYSQVQSQMGIGEQAWQFTLRRGLVLREFL